MDIKKRFGTSKALEDSGVWQELDGKGAAIKVARWNNRRFNELQRQLEREALAMKKGGKLPEDIAQQIIIKAIAHCVLLDWRGLKVDEVALPAYTPEEGIKMLSDQDGVSMAEFRDTVVAAAMDINNFRLEREMEAQGN